MSRDWQQEAFLFDRDLRFDGKTYDPALDRERLRCQLGKVFVLMIDGEWRSLAEIETLTGAPQASISARLRDLRKERFGSYKVERRRRPLEDGRKGGTFEYRVSRGGENGDGGDRGESGGAGDRREAGQRIGDPGSSDRGSPERGVRT